MRDKIVTLTRKELYEQVWSTPMRTLAPRYGLSDVGLAKICKRFDIPRPPVGYWAKKEHGKAPRRPKLPRAGDSHCESLELVIPDEPRSPGPHVFFDPELAKLYEKELHASAPEVPKAVRPHHEIAHASKRWFLECEQRSKRRTNREYVDRWPERPAQALSLDVSTEVLDRTTRLIAGLVKACQRRGYECTVTEKHPRSIKMEALDTTYYVRFREKLKQVKHEITDDERRQIKQYGRILFGSPKWDLKPSGSLELYFGRVPDGWGQQTWRDGKKYKLEERLSGLLRELIVATDDDRRERARRQEEARREAEAERLRRPEAERQQRETQRRDEFLQDVDSWHTARRIRAFVRVVEREARRVHGEIPQKSTVDEWLNWARSVGNGFDPLLEYFRTDESAASSCETRLSGKSVVT